MDHFIRKPKQIKENEDLEFQGLCWESLDARIDEEIHEKYHIFIFGTDVKGRSVCLDVRDFTPHFYVKVPFGWKENEMKNLKYKIEQKLYYHKKHLINCKLMKKKDIDGFNNGKFFKFVRFVFDNERTMKRAMYLFYKPIEGYENIPFKLYNIKSGPMLTFSYIREILFCGWIKVKNKHLKEVNDDISRCQLVYAVNWKNVNPEEKNENASAVTLSFDIECYSYNGDFPDPNHPDNIITQIGSGFCKQNSDDVFKHIVVLGKCDPIEDAVLEWYESEEEVITKWVELVERTDPDLIIGYNIDDFDWKYIWTRAEMLGITDVVSKLSRLKLVPSDFKDDTFESNAFGMNYFRYIKTPGINQLDLLHWFRKNQKLESYSLDNVSKLYLNNQKHPVTAKQIFEMSGPNGKSEERAIVAAYCCHDTFLPIKLMNMFYMIVNLIEMSKVTRVPFMYLVLRGETIKVHSQIAYTAKKENFLIPRVDKKPEFNFSGATVLKPDTGAYQCAIGGLDFASLYPSIIIAHNLCPTTLVKLPKYDNLEGIEYEHFQWDGGNYKFVQNVEGLVPGILKNLWNGRKKVKKEMAEAFSKAKDFKKENNVEEYNKYYNLGKVLNGKQLAIKVSMNSIYGAFGASTFSIPCKPISSTVTYTGRCMIEHSKNCAEKWYDGSENCGYVKAKVIYGDSIMGNEAITIKKGCKLEVKRMDQLAETDWKPYNEFKPFDENICEKLQSTCYATIMTSSGWKKIVRVIKHKTNKRLFRVVTNKGVVVVTEDHSLITNKGEQIKPKDVKIGDKLMHKKYIL